MLHLARRFFLVCLLFAFSVYAGNQGATTFTGNVTFQQYAIGDKLIAALGGVEVIGGALTVDTYITGPSTNNGLVTLRSNYGSLVFGPVSVSNCELNTDRLQFKFNQTVLAPAVKSTTGVFAASVGMPLLLETGGVARITVGTTGNVIIPGLSSNGVLGASPVFANTAGQLYLGSSANLQYLALGGNSAWHVGQDSDKASYSPTGATIVSLGGVGGSGFLLSSVNLPQGSQVVFWTLYVDDFDNSQDMQCVLSQNQYSGSLTTIATLQSSGISTSPPDQLAEATITPTLVIDNSGQNYYVSCNLVPGPTTSTPWTNFVLRAIEIEYYLPV